MRKAEHKLMTVQEVAQYMGLSKGAIYKNASQGRIRVTKKVKRSYLFDRRAIDEWIEKRAKQGYFWTDPQFNDDQMKELYINQRLAMGPTARALGVCRTRIARRLHELKMARTLSEANTKKGCAKNGEYILILLDRNDPLFVMTPKNNRYVPEHRLVIARHLGRPLERWEIVHHKNGIKTDNRIENLQLVSGRMEHLDHHQAENLRLQAERNKLRREIAALKARRRKLKSTNRKKGQIYFSGRK